MDFDTDKALIASLCEIALQPFAKVVKSGRTSGDRSFSLRIIDNGNTTSPYGTGKHIITRKESNLRQCVI